MQFPFHHYLDLFDSLSSMKWASSWFFSKYFLRLSNFPHRISFSRSYDDVKFLSKRIPLSWYNSVHSKFLQNMMAGANCNEEHAFSKTLWGPRNSLIEIHAWTLQLSMIVFNSSISLDKKDNLVIHMAARMFCTCQNVLTKSKCGTWAASPTDVFVF